MHKAIISDTSCLILLEKIGELELLRKLFGVVITTEEVASEFGLPLPSWIEILKGRKFAHQLGLTITGTLGAIVNAKLAGIIPSVKPIITKIKQAYNTVFANAKR